jgi:methionyl-tRNA formyltransferase
MKLTASAVKAMALQRGLPVAQPPTLRDAAAQAALAEVAPDAMVVAAYGLLLPPSVLAIPRLGCLNIHASLLPRWRGAAPVQRALMEGDDVTGISVIALAERMDAGAVFAMEPYAIGAEQTAGELHDALADLGPAVMASVLAGWRHGHAEPRARAFGPGGPVRSHGFRCDPPFRRPETARCDCPRADEQTRTGFGR